MNSRSISVHVAAGLLLVATSGAAQAQALNACDLNNDGVVNTVDINLAVNMSLGVTPCTAAIEGPGVCDVVVVQRVANALAGGACVTGNPHTVSLSWAASPTANVAGYNVYRGSNSGGPYARVNASLIAATSYTDTTVPSGQTFYYVATAVDSYGDESVYSNEMQAVIPTALALRRDRKDLRTMPQQHNDLTDQQWEVLNAIIPDPERRKDGRGRPWKNRREVLNGILYVLRTGVAWAELPECYPAYQTCHRRFQQWTRSGVMRDIVQALGEDLAAGQMGALRASAMSASGDVLLKQASLTGNA